MSDKISGLLVLISFTLWLFAIWLPAYNFQTGMTGVVIFIFAIITSGGNNA